MSWQRFGWILLFLLPSLLQAQQKGEMVFISAGKYLPLYGSNSKSVAVPAFYIDRYPVTHQDFLEFVQKHKEWRRSNIQPIFADHQYLKHWEADTKLGKETKKKTPVIYVSWFAAKNYCQSLGKRLPTLDEWEYVALASATEKDGTKDPFFYQRILDWYSKPTQKKLPDVGSGFKNVYGVYDLHGLIWEWVADFNSLFVTGESRGDSDLDQKLFCGAGSFGAKEIQNYAAFMRYAFRSSLKANYTIANLGFRCAEKASHE